MVKNRDKYTPRINLIKKVAEKYRPPDPDILFKTILDIDKSRGINLNVKEEKIEDVSEAIDRMSRKGIIKYYNLEK